MKFFVIGNIGSGKSTTAKMLSEKLNAKLIDLDKLGHEALDENKSLIEAEFGKFNTRKDLAKIADLKRLDEILYPFIYQKMMDSFSEDNIVVEQTVYEKKFIKHADKVVYVKTNEKIRKERSKNPNFDKLNNNQRHDLEQYADYVIENNGSLEDLEEAINELF
ncbi:MAG: dephospho-CoA kinase [Coriobacteriia bacterium]|nr:dephospho-CoA kinase [Coriobacteriia bacterium]